jgi:hypothetical protein
MCGVDDECVGYILGSARQLGQETAGREIAAQSRPVALLLRGGYASVVTESGGPEASCEDVAPVVD